MQTLLITAVIVILTLIAAWLFAEWLALDADEWD